MASHSFFRQLRIASERRAGDRPGGMRGDGPFQAVRVCLGPMTMIVLGNLTRGERLRGNVAGVNQPGVRDHDGGPGFGSNFLFSEAVIDEFIQLGRVGR